MRRMITLLVFAILLTGHASGARSAEVESTAVGDVQVRAEPGSWFWDVRYVRPILTRKSLLKQAVNKVSRAAATSPDISDVAKLELEVNPDGLIRVTVNSYDKRVPADQLLRKLADALENALRASDVAHFNNELRAQLQQRDVARIANELAKEHEALVKLAAKSGLSPNAELSAQQQMRLETELQGLGVELKGLNARRRVIEHQIGKLAENVTKDPAHDAVIKALQARVDTQMAMLNRLQDQNRRFAGVVTGADLAVAKTKAIEAEAELAKFRASATREAGGGRIANLKGRLDDTAIEMAEIEARRDAVQELIEKMWKGSGEIEMQRLEVERLKRDYAAAAAELGKLRLTLRLHIDPQVRMRSTE